MTETKQSVWPLVLMLIWYAILLAGAGAVFFFGLAFGSEAYRSAGIPVWELLLIASPLVLVIILILATALFWNSGKRTVAYSLCGVSLLPLLLAPLLLGAAL